MKKRSHKIFICLVGVLLAAASLSAEETAGFPVFRAVRAHLALPVIDGRIADGLPEGVRIDTGWRAGGRITLSGGLPVSDVAFMGLNDAKGDFLYFGFEVRHDPTLDAADAVVIGLRPAPREDAGWQENDLVLVLYPFSKDGQAAEGGPLSQVEIWKYAPAAGFREITDKVKGCEFAVRSFPLTESSRGWDMEIKLPAKAAVGGTDWVDIEDRFAFYFNVLRVQSGAMPSVSQFSWPQRAPRLAGALAPLALDPSVWGRADKSESAPHKGLWIEPRSMTIAPGNPVVTPEDREDDFLVDYEDAMTVPNKFQVTVKNDTELAGRTNLTYLEAQGVSLALSTADWGIAGAGDGPDWLDMNALFPPSAGSVNPTKPKDVPKIENPAQPAAVVFDYNGSIGPRIPDAVKIPKRRVLRAAINAPAGTYLREPETARALITSSRSVLTEPAMISVRGYGPAPAGKGKHAYLLRSYRRTWIEKTKTDLSSPGEIKSTDMAAADLNKSDINSYFEWTIHGFLFTGASLEIRGRNLEVAAATGAFGYRMRRPTEVRRWVETIEGARTLAPDAFLLEIPADEAVEITTGLKTEETLGLSVALHAGGSVPMYIANGAYVTGIGVALEGSLKITQLLAVLVGLGYNFMPDAAGGYGYNVFSANINIRASIELSPAFYLYLQGGLYGYTPDFSYFDIGISMALAGGWKFSPNLGLEAGVHYSTGLDTSHACLILQPRVGLVMSF